MGDAGEVNTGAGATIGIGAGPHCDGQVLVIHDLLGMNFGFTPKFVRPFAEFGETGLDAVGNFCEAVRAGNFPSFEESFGPRNKKPGRTLLFAEK